MDDIELKLEDLNIVEEDFIYKRYVLKILILPCKTKRWRITSLMNGQWVAGVTQNTCPEKISVLKFQLKNQ